MGATHILNELRIWGECEKSPNAIHRADAARHQLSLILEAANGMIIFADYNERFQARLMQRQLDAAITRFFASDNGAVFEVPGGLDAMLAFIGDLRRRTQTSLAKMLIHATVTPDKDQ